jgi:FtsP/CotA-like multicopper oxidase with cupredoxin domain
MLVNGKVWPYLKVEPRMYRLRILNGCNARILNLDIGGPTFWQIGAEGGLFDIPVLVKQMVLAPAERADVLVDFSKFAGETLVMKNHKPHKPVSNPAPQLESVMQIRVGTTVSQPGPTTIPSSLPGRKADLPDPVRTRYITLNEIDPEEVEWYLNLSGMRFDEPTTETPEGRRRRRLAHVNPTGVHARCTSPRHLSGRETYAVQRGSLRGGVWRPERRSRRDRPDAVRHRPEGTSGARGARLQGHGQGEPRLLHDDPREVRPPQWRGRTADLRSPLPHRRARGQRHDAAVYRRALTSAPVA